MTQLVAWEDTREALAAARDRWLATRAPEAYRCDRCGRTFPFMCVTLRGPCVGRPALVFHKPRIAAAEQDDPRTRLERLRDAYTAAGAPASSPYGGFVRSLNKILEVFDQLPLEW